MGKGAGSREEPKGYKCRDYVAVIDTHDEWEDLIGRVEEFMDPDGTTHEEWAEGYQVVVWFPTLRDDIATAKLVGVNHFPGYVLNHLRRHDNLQAFELKHLEPVNPDDL